MPGCNDCKNHKSNLGEFVDGKFELFHHCLRGNMEEMVVWWAVNGHQTEAELLTELDCHEYHDATLHLIEMGKKLDEMLLILKDKTPE